jgi:integrase
LPISDPNPENPIEDFLGQYSNEGTKGSYRSNLFSFFDSLYGQQRAGRTYTAEEAERYGALARQLLATEHPTTVLSKYVVSLAGSPPTTAAQRLAVVLDWLAYHHHEVSARERKTLNRRMPKGGAQTMEGDLDHGVLRAIVQQLDLRGRAIVLMLASSGMRIGELLQIQMKDIDLAVSPAEIQIRGQYTKTGTPRTVFISSEAAATVREWLKIRDDRENLAIVRSAGLGAKRRDNRIFPYRANVVRMAWLSAVRKAGLHDVDPATNRSTLHIHMLRKFYHSQMKIGCPEEVVEALMGHGGYLSGAYRRYTKREMADYYRGAELYVTILITEEYQHLKEQTAKQIATQREISDALTAKTIRMENQMTERFDEYERKIASLERVVETFQDLHRVMTQEQSEPD